jgi:hypothetical protein
MMETEDQFMTANNNLDVKILSDDPTYLDEFGSHEKIADAIVDIIQQEPDSKFIALTGPWGSGKSSVVKMIQAKLKKANQVIIFDAWAHKNDPLRRAFLETCIDKLMNSEDGILDKKEWYKIKQSLANKVIDTRTMELPRLTTLGILLALGTFLMPFGIALLNAGFKRHINLGLIIPGAFISVIPILIIGALLIRELMDKNRKDNKLRDIFAQLMEKESRVTRTTSFQTPDPTSLEFQQIFRKLMETYLGSNKHKLLIVIDNIDRVDEEDALSIWATMKTFFSFDSECKENWANNLWIVVPFDNSAISKIWVDTPDTKKPIKDSNYGLFGGDATNKAERLAASFLDKTFQITFNVSRPILTNWMSYFEKRFKEAFPQFNNETEIHNIYRIYRERLFSVKSPTPRDVLIFINRIVGLYMIWKDEIPLRVYAIYATLNIDNINAGLRKLNSEIFRDIPLDLKRDDYMGMIAAIFYGVPISKAKQILLETQIYQAIGSRTDGKEIIKSMIAADGFYEVCEEIVSANSYIWANEGPNKIGLLACALESPTDTCSQSHKSIFGLLCESAAKIKLWWGIDDYVGDGIAKLINYQATQKLPESIIINISNTNNIEAEEPELKDIDEAKTWLKTICQILDTAQNQLTSEIIINSFHCPGKPATYINIMKALMETENNKKFIIYFKPRADIDDIFKTVVGGISDRKIPTDLIPCLKVIYQLQLKFQWDTLLKEIESRLSLEDEISEFDAMTLLNGIRILKSFGINVEATIKNLAEDNLIFYFLEKVAELNKQTAAYCLYVALEYNPEPNIKTGMIRTYDDEAGLKLYEDILQDEDQIEGIEEQFANIIIEDYTIGKLFALLEKGKNAEGFIYKVIETIVANKNQRQLISNNDIIDNEAEFYEALDREAYNLLIDDLVKNKQLSKEITKRLFDSDLASLYLAIYRVDKSNEELCSFLIGNLRKLPKDNWIDELNNDNDNLYDLVIELGNKNKLELGIDYRDALDDYITNYLKSDVDEDGRIKRNWSIIINALESSIKSKFIADKIERIIDSSKTQNNIIDLFGSELFNCKILMDDFKNDIIRKCFGNYNKDNRIADLDWFAAVLINCPNIWKHNQYLKALKEEVINALKEKGLSDKRKSILDKIVKTLNIKNPPKDSMSG